MDTDLSVIIPAYNEAENFRHNKLDQVYSYLLEKKYSFELILVDDGSTDQTPILLKKFAQNRPQVRVILSPHQGKAGTVKAGMLSATKNYRLFTDFDQSTPIAEIEKMLPFFDRGYDLVIGSREVQGAARKKEPWYRHLMGKGFNFVVQTLVFPGIHDTQCGFKMMTAKLAKDIFPKLKITITPKSGAFTGAFDVELIFLANRHHYKIAEVPVQWAHVKTKRVSPIRDSLRMFWQVVRIRLAAFAGEYAN